MKYPLEHLTQETFEISLPEHERQLGMASKQARQLFLSELSMNVGLHCSQRTEAAVLPVQAAQSEITYSQAEHCLWPFT